MWEIIPTTLRLDPHFDRVCSSHEGKAHEMVSCCLYPVPGQADGCGLSLVRTVSFQTSHRSQLAGLVGRVCLVN